MRQHKTTYWSRLRATVPDSVIVAGATALPPPRSGAAPPARRESCALRVLGRRVQTAIWTLQHPASGRHVTLIGTMHMGQRSYFRDLSAAIGALAAAGAEVHVEGIAHRDGQRLTRREQAHLDEADRWSGPRRADDPARLLQLDSQDHLVLPDGARNIDLSRGDLLHRLGWTEYRRLFAPKPAPPPPGAMARTVIRFQLRHSQAIESLRCLRPRHRKISRVVLHERNRHAFDAALGALARGDVALVWGADHLPGLAALFEQAGYRVTGQAWVGACTI